MSYSENLLYIYLIEMGLHILSETLFVYLNGKFRAVFILE